MSSKSPWRPILAPETAERALQVAEEIAADLQSRITASSLGVSPSLAGGESGLALFFSYLDQARPGEGYDDLAMQLLERTISAAAVNPLMPSLYSGFSGVAWTMEHLSGRLYEDGDGGEDAGEEVTAALAEHVALTPWQGHYDLISGLVGFGVFALERLPRPGGEECLRRVVARLSELAERNPQGITWRTGPEIMSDQDAETYPAGYYNLGVAHGVPGVIALLGLAQRAGVECRPLLDGAVRWLLAQQLPPDLASLFGYNVAARGAPVPSRVAWCYGDLGISSTLMVAARAVEEPAWEAEALKIARRTAERSLQDSSVVDAGICHGAAGVAHLFNRLHQATGDPALAEAARHWIDETLALRRSEGIGGFLSWAPNEQRQLGWREAAGFLTGSAGVGLALLGAATAVEPEWDRVLQISPL
jgi:lantibiotic biosynthesis protein